MALTRIYAPSLLLFLFILAHFLDPQHGDYMTHIDQSVLACRHTLNHQSSTAFAVRDATAHVSKVPLSPLLPTASTTPYILRASDSANFFARPSTRPCSFLLDFDLRETFFRRLPSHVLFSGRLQYGPFFRETSVTRLTFSVSVYCC